jgi:rSAM/selenodomain-associated transferase 2
VSISVVIPALNEAACLPETLHELRKQRPHEIIVVDGGSSDRTPEIGMTADQFVPGPRGRAAQMNVGAARAGGDTLLFLHADCTLEPGALHEAERVLKRGRYIAGCYAMTVREDGWLYRMIGACATARVRLTGMVYGDQGLFLRREQFERLGGFPPVHFMEDLFFSKELRKHGRIGVTQHRIFVSPRRWQRAGVIRQTLRNWTLTALAAAGVHPDQLGKFYPALR